MGLWKKWHDVASVKDLEAAGRLAVRVGKIPILLLQTDGGLHAIENRCTHEDAELTAGFLEGHEIECPLHGARFDIRTGTNVAPPANGPVAVFETRVEHGRIWVRC